MDEAADADGGFDAGVVEEEFAGGAEGGVVGGGGEVELEVVPEGVAAGGVGVGAEGDGDVGLTSLAVDSKGNILLAGKGPVAFGDRDSTPARKKWIAKLDPSGHGLWHREAAAEQVVAGAAGEVLCAGGGSAAKLDASGAWIWKYAAGTKGDVRVTAAAVDPGGRLTGPSINSNTSHRCHPTRCIADLRLCPILCTVLRQAGGRWEWDPTRRSVITAWGGTPS